MFLNYHDSYLAISWQKYATIYSSFTKSTIKNQNTQLTEKSVGITIRMFPDYPIEKSQYPINKKISGYYPIHQNFLSGALLIPTFLLLSVFIIIVYSINKLQHSYYLVYVSYIQVDVLINHAESLTYKKNMRSFLRKIHFYIWNL